MGCRGLAQSIQPEVKSVTGDKQENYIAWNGRLFRALTNGFKTSDRIDEWIGNNKEFIEQLEQMMEKYLAQK